MSETSAEIVRGMYAAFHAGDAEGALSRFDHHAVLDATRRLDGGVEHGRERLAATIARWVGAFDDWHERIEEVRELGDLVLVVLTQYGRGKGSGVDIEARYATLFEVRGGSIVRMTLYPDPAEALEEALSADASSGRTASEPARPERR